MSWKYALKMASINGLKKRTKLLACFFRPLIHDIKISRGQKFWLEMKFWPADESTLKDQVGTQQSSLDVSNEIEMITIALKV